MDCRGTVVEFSPAAERMFGYPREAALGQPVGALIVPPRLRRSHEAGLRRYARTGDAPLLDVAVRVPAVRRDGSEFTVELLVSRGRHEGGEAFVAVLREITGPVPADGELLLRADLFRVLVESGPDLLVVLDEAGVVRYASLAATALLGVDRGQVGARLVAGVVHPDDRDRARDAVRRAVRGTLRHPVEIRVRDRAGAWRELAVQIRDLRDHPAVTGIALYGTDATRVRAAERRERIEYARLLTLVESLKVGVLLQDEHGRVVLTNSAFVEMFEPGSIPARERAEDAVRRGRPVFGDEVTLADGRVVERDYVPITLDGSNLGHLWVYRDVTTQAEARRTLQERNRILTELSALKTEFVAVLSHELRTPLTSIATFAEMLDAPGGLDPSEYRAAAGAIRRNADRMLSLVADLLLLARLESGEFALGTGPVDVAALVRAAAAPVGAFVESTDGPPVSGDEDLLRQLLDTTIGVIDGINGSGTRLCAAAEGERWVIRLDADTTEPVTTERLLSTRLAHPRYPGEHRTGALALMLARAIAARHGGELSTVVDPTAVTMTVTLPLSR